MYDLRVFQCRVTSLGQNTVAETLFRGIITIVTLLVTKLSLLMTRVRILNFSKISAKNSTYIG
jgi:hypothetical protein